MGERIAIITKGVLPVPPTRGGAVENLIWGVVTENEKGKRLALEVISIGGPEEREAAAGITGTSFRFIRIHRWIEAADLLLFRVTKAILRGRIALQLRYIFQRLYFILKTALLLSGGRYDKLVFENSVELLLTLLVGGNLKKYRGRCYYHAHNEIARKGALTRLLRHMNAVICVSGYIAGTVRALPGFRPPLPAVTLLNGIDAARFSKGYPADELLSARGAYGFTRDDRVVLYAGRIAAEKGVLELVKAIRLIPDPRVKLLIVGGSFFQDAEKTAYEENVTAYVKAEGLADRVLFTGYLPYGRLPLAYAAADLAVLPSLWREPSMLTALEAMAAGKAVISTKTGGIPENVTGGCGILLDITDDLPYALSKSIRELLSDPERCGRMGKHGRQRVSELFTYERFYRDFADIMNVKKLR